MPEVRAPPAAVAEALAAVAGQPARAAELLGAAADLRDAETRGDPHVVRAGREVRGKLARQAYDRAFDRGRSLRPAAVGER
ncbi:hypothetical protein [Streptomyces sp. NBC_00582]|uniref:hypothetical protein n=1 Tax=Streptomyces sp. NBC_00582 TaxID=2975783 RepID=UPI002E81D8BB|nr:hypothetical protein [Streptomyces sp. NBC_00582]WUB61760.1 hypothetical protein OG852_15840 [Streptomyces sp. NBC_00582]